jgi:hypothetical protein
MAPNTRSRSRLILTGHAQHSLESHTANHPPQTLYIPPDILQATNLTTNNVPTVHYTSTRHVRHRLLFVRIPPPKVPVRPNRLLEEHMIAPMKLRYQETYKPLVTKHKYRLTSSRFKISRRLTDQECWRVLTGDTEVVGPNGCWVALKTTSWDHPFGRASNDYRTYHVNRKGLNGRFSGHAAYTHLAMNVMGLRWALKFTTIVGDVPQIFEVSHLCGHSRCYRPSHLVLDPHQVNLLRARCDDRDDRDCDHGPEGQHCFGHKACPTNCPERLKQAKREKKEGT